MLSLCRFCKTRAVEHSDCCTSCRPHCTQAVLSGYSQLWCHTGSTAVCHWSGEWDNSPHANNARLRRWRYLLFPNITNIGLQCIFYINYNQALYSLYTYESHYIITDISRSTKIVFDICSRLLLFIALFTTLARSSVRPQHHGASVTGRYLQLARGRVCNAISATQRSPDNVKAKALL